MIFLREEAAAVVRRPGEHDLHLGPAMITMSRQNKQTNKNYHRNNQ